MSRVQALEEAILARAERLAYEYRDRARSKRDGILRTGAERLRLREEREEAIARSLGERSFRRKVQASELKMQSRLDQIRWNLVTDVEQRLHERIEAFMADEAAYLATIESFLRNAVGQIESDDLFAELSARDHRLVADRWETIAAEVAPGKSLRLAPEPIETLGGVRIRSADGRIRVDHTFEGRLERLGNRIRRAILGRLLAGGPDTGTLFGG
jgi:V/A-type H+-transporting ATPase subunit E